MATLQARRRAHAAFLKRKEEAGICLRCPQPRAKDRVLCQTCLKARCEESKSRYRANLEASRKNAREWRREQYRKNPDAIRAYNRARYRKNPDLFRGYEFKQHYGITLEQYDALKEKQGGLCAICRKPPMVGKRAAGKEKQPPRLCVDHNHATGKVRGLLCHWCNSHIIAGIEKSGATLKQIFDYLAGGVPSRST